MNLVETRLIIREVNRHLSRHFNMLVEQAIYTSAQTNRGRGYHLVSRSAGITGGLETLLNRWCPSHASLLSPDDDASSLNFHPLDEDHFSLSRTVHGGPEFSQRGGLQVVTLILVIHRKQLTGYVNNPLALARTARALGHIRWNNTFPTRLPSIELPEEASSESIVPTNGRPFQLLDTTISLLQGDKEVALIADHDGLSSIESILEQLPMPERCQLSFTSGLKPSQQRPFRLHVLSQDDRDTQQKLSSRNFHCVTTS